MKHVLLLTTLLILTSQKYWCEPTEDIHFDGQIGIMNNYFWRGIERSPSSNYHISLGWQYQNWSGSFWGTYDSSDSDYVTDFQSNWLEVDSTFSYTWQNREGNATQLGYILYNFYDNYTNSQEVFLRYHLNSSWNPAITLYYDLDFNSGLYYTAEIEKNKVDREWIYSFGLKLGSFSSFGKNFRDQKIIGNRTFLNPRNGREPMTGIADLVPRISLTRYLDEESSITLDLAATIFLDEDTYADSPADQMHFGLSYRVQF